MRQALIASAKAKTIPAPTVSLSPASRCLAALSALREAFVSIFSLSALSLLIICRANLTTTNELCGSVNCWMYGVPVCLGSDLRWMKFNEFVH